MFSTAQFDYSGNALVFSYYCADGV